MTLSKKIKTADNATEHNKATGKYEFLTSEDILPTKELLDLNILHQAKN